MTPMEGTEHLFGLFGRRILRQNPAAPCSPGPFFLLLIFIRIFSYFRDSGVFGLCTSRAGSQDKSQDFQSLRGGKVSSLCAMGFHQWPDGNPTSVKRAPGCFTGVPSHNKLDSSLDFQDHGEGASLLDSDWLLCSLCGRKLCIMGCKGESVFGRQWLLSRKGHACNSARN